MATLRNKRKLAALNKENYEKNPRSNLAQNPNAPRSRENYITQIYLRNLRDESQKRCRKSSGGQKTSYYER